ncbi:hypothetical protein [Clostridium chromiireducens]|uniref:Uncharacterized protein n=1 Tax=Clostridium chromiireducens TaxID=225345 RepID=A0A1V4IH95_9CLOT|nr:hypothetical protein [Clostridium chromiireducens]OPJ59296.1 hypothetical protein CLCHR_35300 [Clostridium chromiireducens]RII33395.1 hypothetical protein D2A34_16745 [Clostridium chromiireducens]
MKYNNNIDILKILANALLDPMSATKNIRESATLKYPRSFQSINSKNSNPYEEDKTQSSEISNTVYSESVQKDDNNKSYDDNKSNSLYDNKKDTSATPQGVIDSIAQELTSVRLQQAIILSEIVGKPRSKTRKKRRY